MIAFLQDLAAIALATGAISLIVLALAGLAALRVEL